MLSGLKGKMNRRKVIKETAIGQEEYEQELFQNVVSSLSRGRRSKSRQGTPNSSRDRLSIPQNNRQSAPQAIITLQSIRTPISQQSISNSSSKSALPNSNPSFYSNPNRNSNKMLTSSLTTSKTIQSLIEISNVEYLLRFSNCLVQKKYNQQFCWQKLMNQVEKQQMVGKMKKARKNDQQIIVKQFYALGDFRVFQQSEKNRRQELIVKQIERQINKSLSLSHYNSRPLTKQQLRALYQQQNQTYLQKQQKQLSNSQKSYDYRQKLIQKIHTSQNSHNYSKKIPTQRQQFYAIESDNNTNTMHKEKKMQQEKLNEYLERLEILVQEVEQLKFNYYSMEGYDKYVKQRENVKLDWEERMERMGTYIQAYIAQLQSLTGHSLSKLLYDKKPSSYLKYSQYLNRLEKYLNKMHLNQRQLKLIKTNR